LIVFLVGFTVRLPNQLVEEWLLEGEPFLEIWRHLRRHYCWYC
jgi:hypothetical protein